MNSERFCLPFTTLPLSSLSRQLSHTASCLSSLLYKQTEPRERGCFEGGRGGIGDVENEDDEGQVQGVRWAFTA